MEMGCVKRAVALCAAGAMIPASVWASVGPPESGEPGKPPQAAFDACQGKSEGTAVEIVTPRGDTIKATCRKFKDGMLVAVPGGPPPSGN
jgi:hypothetical protein